MKQFMYEHYSILNNRDLQHHTSMHCTIHSAQKVLRRSLLLTHAPYGAMFTVLSSITTNIITLLVSLSFIVSLAHLSACTLFSVNEYFRTNVTFNFRMIHFESILET